MKIDPLLVVRDSLATLVVQAQEAHKKAVAGQRAYQKRHAELDALSRQRGENDYLRNQTFVNDTEHKDALDEWRLWGEEARRLDSQINRMINYATYLDSILKLGSASPTIDIPRQPVGSGR